MRIGKLRKTTGFWKSLFFMGNVCRMRRALVAYLEEEGIKAKVEDGRVEFEYNQCTFTVDFILSELYAECVILFCSNDREYEALGLSDKAYLADKVNIELQNHSVVYAFNDEIRIASTFYFTGRRMMLDLFSQHFTELTTSIDMLAEIFQDTLVENQPKSRKIGFNTETEENENEQPDEMPVIAKYKLFNFRFNFAVCKKSLKNS